MISEETCEVRTSREASIPDEDECKLFNLTDASDEMTPSRVSKDESLIFLTKLESTNQYTLHDNKVNDFWGLTFSENP